MRVRLIGDDEAVEIYETRSVLEALAAPKAAERADDDHWLSTARSCGPSPIIVRTLPSR
jgi:DNA-binding GntR family transcriptional regulator